MEDFFNMLTIMVETLKAHSLDEISYIAGSSDGDYEVTISIKKK